MAGLLQFFFYFFVSIVLWLFINHVCFCFSTLQTDFEKDVDIACRSGKKQMAPY